MFGSIVESRMARNAYLRARGIPWLGDTIHHVADRIFPHGKRIWIRLPKGPGKGLRMFVDPRFEPSYVRGDHETWTQLLLQRELRPSQCFYDVGAHKGCLSLIAARIVGRSGDVFSFEPDPDNASVMSQNIQANGLANTQLFEMAAWQNTGAVAFVRVGRDDRRQSGATSRNRFDPISGAFRGYVAPESGTGTAEGQVIQVDATSLDDFIFRSHHRAPDLIKIDVEGGEWEVLEGAQRLLEQLHPKVFCEVHDLTQVVPLMVHLGKLGYNCSRFVPAQLGWPECEQQYVWCKPVVTGERGKAQEPKSA